MLTKVILTVIGNDRPGLTGALADAVLAAGGNWLESQLARLGGKFVGCVLVELPAGQLDTLLAGLDATGLKVDIVAAGEAAPAGTPLSLSVVGQDQPGIVREVTAVLGAIGVNIERLETMLKDGAWSGARLFTAEADLLLPAGVTEADVRDALEAISAEIMVDVTVGA
jgi:glycine cleavage system regulatory protein